MKPNLFFILVAIVSPLLSWSQHTTNNSYYNFGIGRSVIDELLPEGNLYNPVMVIGKYSFYRIKKLNFYAEVQLVNGNSGPIDQHSYEFGSNFGITFKQPLFRRLSAAASIASGPHYITVRTKLQARGFIFSDNFEAGFNYGLPEEINFAIRARYRHISNAGLKNPNGGIDNGFLVVGFEKKW